MKTIADKIFFVAIYLLGITISFAAPTPPSPVSKRPPPPPGLPIDENISIFIIMAIMFGIYIVYKYQLKTKAPV